MSQEDQNEFLRRMLTEMRAEIGGQFASVHGEIAEFREYVGGGLSALQTRQLSIEQYVIALRSDVRELRGDVALIHGYMAQTVQRLDAHEARIAAIEKRLEMEGK